MSTGKSDLLAEALQLPARERLNLATKLLDSVEGDEDPDWEAAWLAELDRRMEEAERDHILRALERTGWVLAGPRGAAELLGMNRSTLWSRMKKLGIEVPRLGERSAGGPFTPGGSR